jgi:hypothetical protein
MIRSILRFHLFLFALTISLLNQDRTQAVGIARSGLPAPTRPYEPAPPIDPEVLRRVYVKDVLNLPVVQQPAEDAFYVSDRNGEATQFALVSEYGNIGILAHNSLSGRHFPKLSIGQEVHVVYSDGRVEYFVVSQILRFQAMQPESTQSSFRNLDRDEVLSAGELFNLAYAGDRRLVFQTCITAEGNVSWGRLFVIALPTH